MKPELWLDLLQLSPALEDLCNGDPMHLKLLDTERQHQLTTSRASILKDLKKCFDTSSRDKDTAIQAAHRDRTLKQAVQDGDIETIKYVTKENSLKVAEAPTSWATIKYGQPGEPSS